MTELHSSAPPSQHDDLLVQLARYATGVPGRFQHDARDMAALCLMDALACAAGALDAPECRHIVGPIVPGAVLTGGSRVPFTPLELDPVRAAFSTGTLIRWLDFSDTTFNGGHPSDNIGALLACADYIDRNSIRSLTMADVFDALIIAYEIQGQIASAVKFDAPRIGLDAVVAVKIASSAAATRLLGGTFEQILSALSSAFVDGAPLNAYRQPPNSGTRKGWAGPRAASNGVELGLMAINGEMGCPRALTAKPWGFFEVMLEGKPIELTMPLGSSVVENVIFKLLPCQRNGTTAAEAAMQVHRAAMEHLSQIREVRVYTHAEALERIDNTTHLQNAAARDHSLQFIVASTMVHGTLRAEHYHEPLATDSRVLDLVNRVRLIEEPAYTAGYVAPDQRSTGNAIELLMEDGTVTGRVEVLYSAGHPKRRRALRPLLESKFQSHLAPVLPAAAIERLRELHFDPRRLAAMRVHDYMSMLVPPFVTAEAGTSS